MSNQTTLTLKEIEEVKALLDAQQIDEEQQARKLARAAIAQTTGPNMNTGPRSEPRKNRKQRRAEAARKRRENGFQK